MLKPIAKTRISSFYRAIYLFVATFLMANCFNLNLFPVSVRRHGFLAGLFMCLAPVVVCNNFRTIPLRMHFKCSILLFVSGFFLSSLTAYFDWGQSFMVTLFAQRFILAFPFFYLLLHGFNVKPHEMKIFCEIIAWFSIAVLLAQFVVPATTLFDFASLEKEECFSREVLQFRFSSFILCLMPMYLCLYSYFKTRSGKSFFWIILLLACYFVGQNRSTLFPLICFFFILLILGLKSKKGIVAFVSVLIMAIFVSFFCGDITNGLIEETFRQIANSDYTRFQSFDFFVFEFSKSPLGYIFGNGLASDKVEFGQFVNYLKTSHHHYYQSDIGLAGDYSKYGLPFVLSLLLIVTKMLKINKWRTMTVFWIFHLGVFTIFSFELGQTCVLVAFLCYITDLNANYDADLVMNPHGNFLDF